MCKSKSKSNPTNKKEKEREKNHPTLVRRLIFHSSSCSLFLLRPIDFSTRSKVAPFVPVRPLSFWGLLEEFFEEAMEVVSEEMCTHCERSIPSSNIDLHYAHCSRKLEKCKVCGDMVPRGLADEHFLNTHAPVSCSLCQEMMRRDVLAIHKGENCPQRIVTCEFCEFPLPAIDLAEHQEVCGNRTELCVRCNRYIRLHERFRHDGQCNGETELAAGPSREIRSNERERRPAGQPHEYSPRRILVTIAITGIAILLGSIFFQKKVENNQVH